MGEPFQIALERGALAAGETLRGEVVFLEPDERYSKCKEVKVECRARVHGSGITEYVPAGEPRVHPGGLSAPLRLPFQFHLPASGPVSYEGRYVKITWEVHVSLDIPWAVDPKRTESFIVRPRGWGHLPGDAPVLSDAVG